MMLTIDLYDTLNVSMWARAAFAVVITLFAYLISRRSKLPEAPQTKTTLFWWQNMFYPKQAFGALGLFVFLLMLGYVLWELFNLYMSTYENMLIATGLGMVVVLMLFRLIVKKWLLNINYK